MVRGDGVGTSFIAKSGDSGKDSPKNRLGKPDMDRLPGIVIDRPNQAITIPKVEEDLPIPAKREQIIDEPHNSALGWLEQASNVIVRESGGVHARVRICADILTTGQAAMSSSRPEP